MKASYPRHRSRNNHYPTKVNRTVTTYSNPVAVSLFTYSGKPGGSTEVIDDIVTPDYTSRMKSGEIFNNPLTYSRDEREYVNSDMKFTRTHPVGYTPTDDETWFGHIGAIRESNPGWGSIETPLTLCNALRASQLAAINARTRINPILVQSLVSAIELPKTISLIRNSITSLLRIRKAVVTGDVGLLKRALGKKQMRGKPGKFFSSTVRDRWLEARYGWTPLVMEVQGAIKALDPAKGFIPRATVRGFSKETKRREIQSVFSDSFRGILNFTVLHEETLNARAYVLYTADLNYQRARDFGVSEFPLAVWELVPFSFVVDWFVRVGDWLNALTPKLGIKIISEGVVLKRHYIFERRITSWTKQVVSDTSYDLTGSFLGSVDRRDIVTITRSPNLNVLFSSPPISVKLNTKRVIDAIALLARFR